jgi:hypothetical protein
MRTQFHNQVRDYYQEEFPHALFLKPYQSSDIYEFLLRWPFPKNRRSEDEAARIFNDLSDRPTLRDMCRNPLVLAMYVSRDQAQIDRILPETRTQFYHSVINELIIYRRARQVGQGHGQMVLQQQRERILRTIAYDHMIDTTQAANSLSWSYALNVISEIMKCDTEKAENIFRDIAINTGIISEEKKGESFRFIHLTFCEFLAAREAAIGREGGWSQLLEAHKTFQTSKEPQIKTRLIEVIPFSIASLPDYLQEAALVDLETVGTLSLLARAFLETKLYEMDMWTRFVHQQHKALINTPEEGWDVGWLAELHLFSIVLADASKTSEHRPMTSTIITLNELYESLLNSQQSSLEKLLLAYASQDAAAAFRLAELSGVNLVKQFPEVVVLGCNQKPFFELVRRTMMNEISNIEHWAWLLVGIAMESRAVAKLMYDAPTIPNISGPKQQHWLITRSMNSNSLYSQMLSVVFHNTQAVVNLDKMPNAVILTELILIPSLRMQKRVTLLIIIIFFISTIGVMFQAQTELNLLSLALLMFTTLYLYVFIWSLINLSSRIVARSVFTGSTSDIKRSLNGKPKLLLLSSPLISAGLRFGGLSRDHIKTLEMAPFVKQSKSEITESEPI